jgi:hypothetical protein
MATKADMSSLGKSPVIRVEGYPAGSLRFDWAITILSSLFMGGLFIDGWAHNHGMVDESFFTIWHALFYSAFGLVALFLGSFTLRNVNKGYAFTKALPRGYWLSLVGVMIFALGGVGDLIWHSLFGIEVNTDALLSPSHLLLGVGMFLIWSGPMRAGWLRLPAANRLGWREAGPLLISATLILTLLMFFTQFTHPMVIPVAAGYGGGSPSLGISSVLIQSALLMGMTLMLVRRWRLPFGAVTLIVTISTLLVSFMQDTSQLVPATLVAGLIADLLLALRPTVQHAQFYLFAFLMPVLVYAAYFISLLSIARIRWTIHATSGAVFLAGVVGLFMAFLIWSPFDEDAAAED